MKTVGFAAYDPKKPLAPYEFERRALRPNDVAMEILFCGVCHSDLHTCAPTMSPWRFCTVACAILIYIPREMTGDGAIIRLFPATKSSVA